MAFRMVSDIERVRAERTAISFDSEETKRFVVEFLRDFIKGERQESIMQEGTIWGDPSIIKQIREARGDGDTRTAQERFETAHKSLAVSAAGIPGVTPNGFVPLRVSELQPLNKLDVAHAARDLFLAMDRLNVEDRSCIVDYLEERIRGAKRA